MAQAQTLNQEPQQRGRFKKFLPESTFALSLLEGLAAGAVLVGLLLLWMTLRADDTVEKIQSAVPLKTTTIEIPKPAEPPVNSVALPVAPIAGLTEQVDGKTLPVSRIEDDMSPFQAYKRPFVAVAGKPIVSLVAFDYGLSEKMSVAILKDMPLNVSLVLTPYSDDPNKWGAQARESGHEFWLTLPMQSTDFVMSDGGPDTLLQSVVPEENQRRLTNVLGKAIGYAGLVSSKNHTLSEAQTDFTPVIKQIFARGLALAESNPAIPAFGLRTALEFGNPYVQNTAWLDDDLRPHTIDRALQMLEQQARQNGKAIAFFRPSPIMIAKVKEWAAQADQKGLQLAPLSAMVQ